MDNFWANFAHELLDGFKVESIRYFGIGGTAFLVFYVVGRKLFLKYKIQQKLPENKNMLREIKYSLMSMGIFAVIGAIVFYFFDKGYTKIYTDFNSHSKLYFAFSILVFIVAHDFYFYFTHRFMHWKKIYPYVHKIHHLSMNPTPWAAYAFHPLEAVVQAGIFPIMIFLMPVHPLAILVWGLYQTFLNVMGHVGFEFFPSGFTTNFISKWHNTSTHHNMHHKYATNNYGLYFNFWDRIMGTNHPQYNEFFEGVKTHTNGVKAANKAQRQANKAQRKEVKNEIKTEAEVS